MLREVIGDAPHGKVVRDNPRAFPGELGQLVDLVLKTLGGLFTRRPERPLRLGQVLLALAVACAAFLLGVNRDARHMLQPGVRYRLVAGQADVDVALLRLVGRRHALTAGRRQPIGNLPHALDLPAGTAC